MGPTYIIVNQVVVLRFFIPPPNVYAGFFCPWMDMKDKIRASSKGGQIYIFCDGQCEREVGTGMFYRGKKYIWLPLLGQGTKLCRHLCLEIYLYNIP